MRYALAGLLVILLLGGVAAYYLLPRSHTSYPVDPATFVKSESDVDPYTGMELMAEVNTTSIRAGQSIGVTVTATNTLTRPNNVTGFGNFPVPGMVGVDAPLVWQALGLSVYEGYYTRLDVSSAVALYVFPPLIEEGGCGQKAYFIFQPYSDNGSLYMTCRGETAPGFLGPYTGQTVIPGTSTDSTGLATESFEPGIYTLAAGSIWGQSQFVLLYFVVK
jgi:hypothetical protein